MESIAVSERLERIGTDAPAWILVHGVHGMERGKGATQCMCASGQRCASPGKHPVARLFPAGAKDAVPWRCAAEMVRTGAGRLAAVLVDGERVLDADSAAGAAQLWRSWTEVEDAWGVAATPRGFHIWQWRGDRAGAGSAAAVNAGRRFVGGDVKESGYLVWPDGRQRYWIGADGLAERLARRSPGTPRGTARIVSGARRGVPSVIGGAVEQDPVRRLAALTDRLRRAAPGERNDLLNWCGWIARGTLGGGSSLTYTQVAGELRSAALAIGLDPAEVERTIRSGLGDQGSHGG